MIEFVDLKNGRVFNGDMPYVFWFENGQSVNLNYIRKICFISDKKLVEVRLKSDVFSLLYLHENIPAINDPITGEAEIINEKLYLDLSKLKTDTHPSIGVQYNNFYVHMIYILGSSSDAGEIHDYFTISDNVNEYTFEIAADFYADNELLKNQLENFDISIPESIQKAIFDVDVHEESNDNITLNRKYKELLMNYWDIVANKGSYNSLQNSLAWFEWGDLVRIEELWRRHHEGMEEYFRTDLNRDLDPEFIKQFLNHGKTTYIGLYMALSRMVRDSNGQVEYQSDNGRVLNFDGSIYYPSDIHDGDTDGISSTPYTTGGIHHGDSLPMGNFVYVHYVENPTDPSGPKIMKEQTDLNDPDGELIEITADNYELLSNIGFSQSIIPTRIYNEILPRMSLVTTRWQLLDLCLKMTLLGNFYSTYFVPIHMDVIHSTLEHWVMAYTIKVLHTNYTNKYACVIYGRSFDMEYDHRVKMMDHLNRGYGDIILASDMDVFGFDDTIRDVDPSMIDLRYMRGGSYGVVRFRSTTDNPILATDENDRIIRQRISWVSDQSHGSYTTQAVIEPTPFERPGYNASQYIFDLDFRLGFIYPGDYTVIFEFYTSSGNMWCHKINLTVEDTTGNYISLYKVKPLESDIIRTMQLMHDDDQQPRWQVWLKSFQMKPSLDPYNDDENPPADTHLGGDGYRNPLEYHPYKDHSIFLMSFKSDGSGDENQIGFNHTVIFTVSPGDYVDIKLPGTRSRQIVATDKNGTFIELTKRVREYIWITNQYRYTENGVNKISDIRVIGICRSYNKEIIKDIQINGGTNTDWVSSMRFQPCMHRIELFENTDEPVGPQELIYAEPHLAYSRDMTISNWSFRNMTTQKEYDSHLTEWRYYPDGKNYGDFGDIEPGGMQGLFIAPQEKAYLEPGYYNIYLNYRKGDQNMQFVMNSAFLIGK